MTYSQNCRSCGYVWNSRIPNPKACPLCKRYRKVVSANIKQVDENGLTREKFVESA